MPVSTPARRMGLLLVATALIAACSTSPTGRRTVKLYNSAQMDQMGLAAYEQTKQELPTSKSGSDRAYVACVSRELTNLVGGQWEVTLFEDDSANAFALPGGKIGVNTGLLKVAQSPAQLAAVIGHEIAHVQAEHSNERLSASSLAGIGMELGAVAAGAAGVENQALLMAALGMGVQVGALLPFSRTHESEADILGQNLMARAGFDPRESAALWQNMAKNSGGAPPEWMSTHPSHSTRIGDLQQNYATSVPLYEQARSAGRKPSCKRG